MEFSFSAKKKRSIKNYFSHQCVLTLFCFKGCLHRAADLTLVPSVAIAEDFETAKVVPG